MLGAAALAAIWLVWLARGILTPLIVAAVLAYLLDPPVRFVQRVGVPRAAAIAAVYLILFGGAGLAVWLVLPRLAVEWSRFAEQLPGLLAAAEGFADRVQRSWGNLAAATGLQGMADAASAGARRFVDHQARAAAGLVLALPSVLLTAALAPLLGFYLLQDGPALAEFARRCLPLAWRGDLWRLGCRLEEVVGGFLRGQVVVAAIVGGLVGLVAGWLGLPYAALIGLVAGVFDMIPYFGPIIGAIPAVVVALTISPLKAAQVVVAFLIIQQLENMVIGPRVLGARVGLHPLTVIMATLFGGQQAGLPGLLLSVPATAALKVIAGFAWDKLIDYRERLNERP